ncbi:uncharacterized protein LOC144121657 isoform X2 [Amblyomma americanum]
MSPVIVQDACWTIPVVAACAAFFTMLTSSSSGLLYVLFMDEFDISHEEAAWPVSVQAAVGNSMGLVLAVLQQKMPVYHMALLGALVAFVGLVASSFAPDITWMSAFLGGVYAAGAGMLITSFTLFTLVYFDKYRATATACKYVGWAVSGVVGPNLLSYAAENYGCRPSLLLVGAITAHAIPLVMLVQSPRPLRVWCSSRKKSSTAKAAVASGGKQGNYSNTALSSRCPLRSEAAGSKYGSQRQAALSIATGSRKPKSVEVASNEVREFRKQSIAGVVAEAHERNAFNLDDKAASCFVDKNPQSCRSESSRSKYLMINAPNFLQHCASLFRSGKFYMLVATFMAMEYTIVMHETTIVAYGIDKKAGTLKQCNQLQTFTAVGQLVGRLVVPFLSDQIPFSRCPLTASSLALSATCFILVSFTKHYVMLLVLTTVAGVCEGFLLCIRGVLYGDYLGVVSMGLASGLQGLCMVPAFMGAPASIGHGNM